MAQVLRPGPAKSGRMMREYARNPAPGALEALRTLLNSRSIAHGSREWVDELARVATSVEAWSEEFGSSLPMPPGRDLAALAELRDDLRGQLGAGPVPDVGSWLERHLVVAVLDAETRSVRHRPAEPGCLSVLLAIVVEAVVEDRWKRLRACPDCRRVFYDRSPNLSRVWCGMYAEGDAGRACGTNAKVAAFRQRKKAASGAGQEASGH